MRPDVFIKKNGSTILTCVGAVGVVGTAVLTVKSTTKANLILSQMEGQELTKAEKLKLVAPIYIPPVLMGAGTIACIFGANAMNKRTQAALISAYGVLDRSYKEYREKVEALYGEEATKQIKEELKKDHCPRSR